MHKIIPTTKMLTGAIWLLVVALVGMAPNRIEASCGDYLNHKHFPSGFLSGENSPFDPISKSQPVSRCQSGQCDRSPMPLPVDPLSPRVTIREIAKTSFLCITSPELECEDWSDTAQPSPSLVFLGGPLKPPIL